LLLILVAVLGSDDPEHLLGYVRRLAPEAAAADAARGGSLAALCRHAVNYYKDFIEPRKRRRAPTPAEADALRALMAALRERAGDLEALPPDDRARAIQDLVYDAGRREPFLDAGKEGRPGVSRAWFNALYQVLLGQPEGPRFGSFVALYGIPGTVGLIETALAREAA
jgi:lysyl-tRNA synthetase class 1